MLNVTLLWYILVILSIQKKKCFIVFNEGSNISHTILHTNQGALIFHCIFANSKFVINLYFSSFIYPKNDIIRIHF